jgi:signal transduction histidine kinase
MFRVSARTILELGSELISSDIIAFYELVKNGFDARTTSGVEIHFEIVLRRNKYLGLLGVLEASKVNVAEIRQRAFDELESDASLELLDGAKEYLSTVDSVISLRNAMESIYQSNAIVVSDTGSGMSLEDLAKNFLMIGTNSRKTEVDKAITVRALKTPYLGEKGIGRLSAMRLGNRLRVETARVEDVNLNILEINWNDFSDPDAMLEDIRVESSQGPLKENAAWSGTKIVIRDLSEDWTARRVEELTTNDFARLSDPFEDQKNRPRIVLHWNKDRLTIPWMNRALIENAHALVSGEYYFENGQPRFKCYMEVSDLGFPHPKESDTINLKLPDIEALFVGTIKEIPDTALYRIGSFKFEAYWYNRQRLTQIDTIGKRSDVKKLQEKYSGILLFRDGFRVFPYGDDDDDWLGLDRFALRRSGYTLNKTQFVGRICISRTTNPFLVDQTNREGLRETPEQQVLVGVMQWAIQDGLYQFIRSVERQYKSQKVDLTEAKSEVVSLENRAKSAVQRLRRIIPRLEKQVIEDVEQTLFEFSEFAERARMRIGEVEQESRQLVEMAGVGLMIEVVAHELARVSDNAIQNLDGLRGKNVPLEVQKRLESLRVQMKSLSKRIRVLDPLSVSGRQRLEVFDLNDVIKEMLEAHEAQFQRHNIRVDYTPQPIRVRAVKGMVVQVLENLVSNSKYWMQMRRVRDHTFAPTISIVLESNPPRIVIEDNGRGVAIENRDKVFQPFFSLKEKSKRRGLGLYIARECAEYNSGTLVLDDTVNAETGRLHRFVLELPETVSER